MIEILSITIRAVRGIGGADGNAVAAALAKGLVHKRIPAVYGIGPKAYGLVGTYGDASTATPAEGVIHGYRIALVLSGASGHGGGGQNGGGGSFDAI